MWLMIFKIVMCIIVSIPMIVLIFGTLLSFVFDILVGSGELFKGLRYGKHIR